VSLEEEVPVNVASGGEVAGLDQNPPVYPGKKKKLKLLRRYDTFRKAKKDV
jgi:hypothetical protein